MIGSVNPSAGRIDARTLPAVFSNHTRCPRCQRSDEIRVHYDPGCAEITGAHYHRHCPCGHSWAERSAGHARSDIVPGDPRFVLLCECCGTRVPDAEAPAPRCCRRPEVHYHEIADPCDACGKFRRIAD